MNTNADGTITLPLRLVDGIVVDDGRDSPIAVKVEIDGVPKDTTVGVFANYLADEFGKDIGVDPQREFTLKAYIEDHDEWMVLPPDAPISDPRFRRAYAVSLFPLTAAELVPEFRITVVFNKDVSKHLGDIEFHPIRVSGGGIGFEVVFGNNARPQLINPNKVSVSGTFANPRDGWRAYEDEDGDIQWFVDDYSVPVTTQMLAEALNADDVAFDQIGFQDFANLDLEIEQVESLWWGKDFTGQKVEFENVTSEWNYDLIIGGKPLFAARSSGRVALCDTLPGGEAAQGSPGSEREQVLSHESSQADLQSEFSEETRIKLARYSTDLDILSALFEDNSNKVKFALALNKNTPTETLIALTKVPMPGRKNDKEDWDNLQGAIARNPNTPVDVLEYIANNKATRVSIRADVAVNPSASPEVLTELLHDQSGNIPMYAASNPNLPRNLLPGLGKSADSDIRRGVANNPNTPRELLTELLHDEDGYVRTRAAANSNVPRDLLTALGLSEDREIRSGVASNTQTPPEVLKQLANGTDEFIRECVAGNPNTPPEVLAELAHDIGEPVRSGEPRRWSLHSVKTIREAVARNPQTPPELLAELSHCKGLDLIKTHVARNPHTPQEILAQLAHDKDWSVRVEVAGNPQTPHVTLEELTNDKKRRVSDWAKVNLAGLCKVDVTS